MLQGLNPNFKKNMLKGKDMETGCHSYPGKSQVHKIVASKNRVGKT